jgi:CRP-like cAMP-binding protein
MLTVLEKEDLLQRVEIFSRVPTESLARIASIAEEVAFEAHQQLVGEEQAAEAVYVLLEGEVALSRLGRAEGRLSEPQARGALALLADQPYRETATAGSPCRTLRIDQQELWDAMAEDFNIARGIIEALGRMAVLPNNRSGGALAPKPGSHE